MTNVITSWLSVVFELMHTLFELEIVSGVSFGSFLLVIIIFGVVVSFFLSRITHW